MESLKQSMLRAHAAKPPQAAAPQPLPSPANGKRGVVARPATREPATLDTRLCALDRKLNALIRMLREPAEEQCGPDYLRVADVRRVVTRYFAVGELDIDRVDRSSRIARIRQIAFYLCRQHTTRSLVEIGKLFGSRDHTTVLHGIRRIDAMRRADRTLASDLSKLEARLAALAARRRDPADRVPAEV